MHYFLGEYNHTIDSKGRLTIPSKFRSHLAKGLVVTKGLEKHLVIYPMDEWEVYQEKIKLLATTNPKMRDFRRRVFAGAAHLEPDRQGRILLPQNLRQFAEIETDAVIVGMSEVLEVWSAKGWDGKQEQLDSANPEDWEGINV